MKNVTKKVDLVATEMNKIYQDGDNLSINASE